MIPELEAYIQLGWKIFPCHHVVNGTCSCRDTNCSSPGKHPRTSTGFHAGTSDRTQIESWAGAYPGCNWGLATGEASGVIVIDIDPRKDGFESWDEYEGRSPHNFGGTLIANTGGAGRHLYLKPADGTTIGNRANWLPGVDVRGTGGYVILPPGNHISGGVYSWADWDPSRIMILPPDVAADLASRRGGSGGGGPVLPSTEDLLGGIEEGGRDDALFRMACRLRRQLNDSRPLVESLVLQAAANSRPPFPREEALRKVDQAFLQSHEEIREVQIFGMGGGGGDGEAQEAEGDGEGLFRLTDMGNRDRFISAYGDDLRYVTGMGWHKWADDGWHRIDDLIPHRLAQDVPQMIRLDAQRVDDVQTRGRFMRFADDTESAARINSIITLAKGHEEIMKSPDDFDSEPHLLACQNGMVDLRDGSIRPFRREDLFTRNTRIMYDPDFTFKPWDDFLASVTEGYDDLTDYLQMAAGYTLTGSVEEESFFIISGPTRSGKTTYLEGLQAAMGGYTEVTGAETFMRRFGKEAPREELVKFAGARLVATEELPEGERFDDALLKRVTGGSRISARYLYQESFAYMPQFKLWMATNHDPVTDDSAMFRRIKRVPFMHSIPEEQQNRELKRMLKDPTTGARAVLNWAIKGAIKYFEAGHLVTPMSVRIATDTYQMEQNSFGAFLNETVERQADAEILFKMVYTPYVEWCKQSHEKILRRPAFITKLRTYGYDVTSTNHGEQKITGMRLRQQSVGNLPIPFQ